MHSGAALRKEKSNCRSGTRRKAKRCGLTLTMQSSGSWRASDIQAAVPKVFVERTVFAACI